MSRLAEKNLEERAFFFLKPKVNLGETSNISPSLNRLNKDLKLLHKPELDPKLAESTHQKLNNIPENRFKPQDISSQELNNPLARKPVAAANTKSKELAATAMEEACGAIASLLLDTIDSPDGNCLTEKLSESISELLNESRHKTPGPTTRSATLRNSCSAGVTSSVVKWSVNEAIGRAGLGNTQFNTICTTCSSCYSTFNSAVISITLSHRNLALTKRSVDDITSNSSASSLMDIETRFISIAMIIGLLFFFLKRFK